MLAVHIVFHQLSSTVHSLLRLAASLMSSVSLGWHCRQDLSFLFVGSLWCLPLGLYSWLAVSALILFSCSVKYSLLPVTLRLDTPTGQLMRESICSLLCEHHVVDGLLDSVVVLRMKCPLRTYLLQKEDGRERKKVSLKRR
jgi:hypothetical protein